jgi:hypothetical protein
MQRQVLVCPNVQVENSRTNEKRNIVNNAFKIDFTCYADNNSCQKAWRAFERAGIIISEAFVFKTQIVVNATFVPFCETMRECQKDHIVTLGGSYPARTMAMARDDGVARLYPQALIKQLGYNPHPTYNYYDIVSLFNADAPFWFEVCEGSIVKQYVTVEINFLEVHRKTDLLTTFNRISCLLFWQVLQKSQSN